jgi:HAAS domain-containing protein
MSTLAIDLDVRSYLAALERCLDDLPLGERRELLEDLEEHLAEVAAEGDGTLVERLGPPDVYAAELRASAGLPPRDRKRAIALRARERLGRSAIGRTIQRTIDGARNLPIVRKVIAFLPEVRPGWWVFRGYLLVATVDAVFFIPNGAFFSIPRFNGNILSGLLAIAVWVWASVAIGRASTRDVRARRASWVLNIGVVVLALAAMPRMNSTYYAEQMQYTDEPQLVPYLHHADGSPITNICAYSTKLKPLDHVVLFDQDGRPIEDLAERPSVEIIDENGTIRIRKGGFGNVFPRSQIVPDPQTGAPTRFSCPTIDGFTSGAGAEPGAEPEKEKDAPKASKEKKAD